MKKLLSIIMISLLLASMLLVSACSRYPIVPDEKKGEVLDLKRFNSLSEIESAFEEARKANQPDMIDRIAMFAESAVMTKSLDAATTAAPQAGAVNDASAGGAPDYSETNVQVQGVDEADIVKTDGKYIYTLSGTTLNIVEAYPADEVELLSSLEFDNFYPTEFFINGDRLIIFGSANLRPEPIIVENDETIVDSEYYRNTNFLEARIYDVSDREDPELVKTVDVEGSYVSSRMIDDYVYYAVSTYPYGDHFIPLMRETINEDSNTKITDIVEPNEIGYFQPILAESFISIIALPVDETQNINKEVIVGSASNMFVSLDNMFIVQSRYGWYGRGNDNKQETNIYKLELNDGEIEYKASGVVSGTILNQFSMDEYDNNFRIATTVSGYSNNVDTSYNNMYVLDEDLEIIGEVEDIAPGESIYSVRFMGKRAYMVTFKHVDPLFVIDLSDPENPKILGKLKIPGYSDYLHPYDETHLIGIGKEVDASIDADKIHTEGAVYYTAIQGVKLAVFDVSDVSNPIEMYKEVIGVRGTESEAAQNHKAFLFDKARELLVIPITVAELKSGQSKSSQGEYTFQGAYVYNLNLEDGFDLRGRVSHIEDNSTYAKSGYRLGDYNDHVRRSLFIDDILYTISNNKIKLNDLGDLEELNAVELENSEGNRYPERYY